MCSSSRICSRDVTCSYNSLLYKFYTVISTAKRKQVQQGITDNRHGAYALLEFLNTHYRFSNVGQCKMFAEKNLLRLKFISIRLTSIQFNSIQFNSDAYFNSFMTNNDKCACNYFVSCSFSQDESEDHQLTLSEYLTANVDIRPYHVTMIIPYLNHVISKTHSQYCKSQSLIVAVLSCFWANTF